MLKKIIATLFILIAAFEVGALDNKVVAIVADQAITQMDIEARTKLIMLTSGYDSHDKEAVKALSAQVLELLIDENLIAIEAKRISIALDGQELYYSLEQIADKNKMTVNEFIKNFSEAGGSIDELKKQIGGQLLWQKLIQIKLQPEIMVTQSEINEGLKLFNESSKANISKTNKLDLSSIMLIDDGKDSESFAKELVEQLNKGAIFEKLAADFSQASNASSGGEVGLVSINQLPKEVQLKMKVAKEDDIIGPIKVNGNWMIYKVNLVASSAAMQNESEVKELIQGRKLNASIRGYLRKLRRQTYVEIKNNH